MTYVLLIHFSFSLTFHSILNICYVGQIIFAFLFSTFFFFPQHFLLLFPSSIIFQSQIQLYSVVPETYLKKRAIVQRQVARKAKATKVAVDKARKLHKIAFTRGLKYASKYRSIENNALRQKRQAKKTGQFFVPQEAKVFFVIRILGTYGVAPKVRKILQLLRLLQINNGTFIRVNKATLNMLVRAGAYITWGEPSVKAASDLIYKRGFARIAGQRVPITNNKMIKKTLGQYGIVCIEDVIHEIITCGRRFKQVNTWLNVFKLNTPTGGWKAKKIHFITGGDAGYRGDAINALLANMI
jgi:60S ribosomal protein uL30